MKIVIDTSVYIEYSRSAKGIYQTLIEKGRSKSILYTPSIVVLEMFAGKSVKGAKEKELLKRILKPAKEVDLTRQLAQMAGELIRSGQIEETEDAIIAATAIYLDAELATLNKKHFIKVRGLKIYKEK